MILVKPQHCRQIRYCAKGVRLFFKRYDLDYAKFITVGIPADELEKTGDAMALEAVKVARNGG